MSKQEHPRRNSGQWQEIIARQKAGGESVSAYCRKENLSEKSFYAWRRRLGKRSSGKLKDFIELSPVAPSRKESLRIRTPGGYCLEVAEGTDITFVNNIIAALVSK